MNWLKLTNKIFVIYFFSVRISVKQPAAQPLKVPPPVKPKPQKKAPASDSLLDDFPPPPPDMIISQKPPSGKSAIEDELDALTDMLTLGLENTTDPDFFGKLIVINF